MMRWTLLLGGLLVSTSAVAFDVDDLARFKATGRCPGCDLSNADLEHFRWPASVQDSTDLRGANLRGAKLNGAKLPGADLRGADLRGANLATANLNRASLRGADLSGAFASFINLERADLSGATLRDMQACYDQDFTRAVLHGADLRNAKLCATNWFGADLTGADLRGADLTYGVGPEQSQIDRACGDAATKPPAPKITIPSCPSDP